MADYVALMGAYERDNFGDILFLRVTERLLEPWPVVPLSVVSADMAGEGGGHVVSASSWFEVCGEHLPRALLFVGGQTLDCRLSAAVTMDIAPEQVTKFRRLGETHMRSIGQTIAWRSGNLPYVSYRDYFDGHDRQGQRPGIAYNSIGGTSLGEKLNGHDLDELKTALRDADYISVRDTLTQTALSRLAGKSVELNPDVVTLVSSCCEAEVAQGRGEIASLQAGIEGGYLVFQASEDFIRTKGSKDVAQALAGVTKRHGLSILLQPAGIAYWHDSFESLQEIQAFLLESDVPSSRVVIQRSRDIWAQVAAIADAECFIGTSLHGRIVATSFARPRVALENDKVAAYAETWESGLQPINVGLADLSQAVATAMSVDKPRLVDQAEQLIEKTAEAFSGLRRHLGLGEISTDIAETKGGIDNLKIKALLADINRLRKNLVDLSCRDSTGDLR